MLQPKKRKHKKEFRGKMRGIAQRGNTIAYGDFALQALDRGWINGNQIEAARKAIVRETKRKGKTWLMIFPHKPFTSISSEVKRGGGKGNVEGYVAVVKPGRVIFEVGGLTEDMAKQALKLAAQKFPIKTRIISK
ncbi:50S ribosomal protein L16 [Candidatus Dojkabacteria bacterium]|uniref:Large ribosomal subunit protein uL16 n=1 Tax=Candidatus Dojkabacteria bacterium TaxID=2099670 RepID=A0A955LBT2_9BACT|nr:50S ribosomal protein L16 [Candidatus Dojkabacteria bacterium]